ncbi:MAG: hypothetical protein ABI578_04270 [Chloroflexota bacterium]
MSDAAFGYLLLALGIAFVLGAVYAVTSHISAPSARPKPPPGVHLPNPSALPVILAVGGALLGAGLAFRADKELANPFLAIPGLLIFLYAVVAWVRAAGREWEETERGPHDGASGQ